MRVNSYDYQRLQKQAQLQAKADAQQTKALTGEQLAAVLAQRAAAEPVIAIPETDPVALIAETTDKIGFIINEVEPPNGTPDAP